MEVQSIFLYALVSVLALYLLNKVFNYKNKIVNSFGIIKYKLVLSVIISIVFIIITYKYEISFFSHPIGLPLICSYCYLVNVTNKPQNL